MSREIKFRAWSQAFDRIYSGSEMLRGNLFLSLQDGALYTDVLTGEMKPTSRWVVMQYTGLKDKNGKEIHEGDVVDLHSWKPSVKQTRRQVVEWIGSGLFMRRLDGTILGYSELSNRRLEVIGNIYENPELLGGK